MSPHRLVALCALALVLGLPCPATGQDGALRLTADGRVLASVPLVRHRGYAALPASGLAPAGWSVEGEGDVQVLRSSRGLAIEVRAGSPYLAWGSERVLVQLAVPPYRVGTDLFLPLQLVTDVLPDRLPELYRAPGPHELRLLAMAGDPEPGIQAPAVSAATEPGAFVVVIDPGHGGADPGAMGPSGTREKDVALRLGRALADELASYPDIEVHLTRDRDVLVPLWKRGETATRLKGERPGIFLSIHANAVASRSVRGVETYFLSEARTEHERRVAALENASLELEPGNGGPAAAGDLGFILTELRNHDHLHWSSELAVVVQRHLASSHPGPDRGVKQGPFAVITNALMPAVLIEAGFITHPDEERALGDDGFHREIAGALARAVAEFAERYPPGRPATQRERP